MCRPVRIRKRRRLPLEEETAGQRERSGERPASEAPRRKRDWGSIFQKTFDKINKSFSAAEDEEI